MAAGTIVSRLSGYVRTVLLAAALGNLLHADVFNLANTVPNMLYILLAGGIFNAVLVPQLVRTMKNDPDGGDAYANRIVSLAALFLGTVTVLLVVAAPWIMQIFLPAAYADPALAAQRDSVIAFARLCLPQVFFYGMFVLAGQILNARGRFGPMMWAPIANNVIAVGVLVIYLVTFGAASAAEQCAGFSTGQELLLGLGSTAGIVVQFLVLVPYLRATGFRFHPRFDFRDAGLGHTLRLGAWTVGFVIVNQIAYTVVVRLASSGTAQAQLGGECVDRGASLADQGTGLTIYANSFLMMMVPHAIVTVSLATAVLPRLAARAADTDLAGLARTLAETLRTALAVVLPFAALLPIIALDLANALFGLGAGRDSFALYQPVLALFGPGLVFFTVHYLMLRGFYALERNRTVFLIQCGIAAVNIAVAVALVTRTDPRATAPVPGDRLRHGVRRRVGRVVHRAAPHPGRPAHAHPGPVPGADGDRRRRRHRGRAAGEPAPARRQRGPTAGRGGGAPGRPGHGRRRRGLPRRGPAAADHRGRPRWSRPSPGRSSRRRRRPASR